MQGQAEPGNSTAAPAAGQPAASVGAAWRGATPFAGAAREDLGGWQGRRGGGAVGRWGNETARWQLRQGRAAQAGQAQTCSKPVCMECTFLERSLKSSNEVHNVLAAYIRYIKPRMPHHVQQGLALTLGKTTLLNKTCDQNFCSGQLP